MKRFLLLPFAFSVFVPAAVRAGEEAKPSPDFVGIELGPGILNAIQKRTLIKDWSQREIDAYYEVLDFARRTDYAEQKAKARENVLAEIERLREKVEGDYEQQLQTIEERADELGALKTARAKAIAAQRRRQALDRCEEYRDNPLTFPLFVQMTNSMVRDEHSRFAGKLVTLTGHVRKLLSYDALPNKFGVKRLHEAWLYTDDSQHNPTVVICTQVPDGMPRGERISETVTVTGYVFRLHYYRNRIDQLTRAPMILASRLEWQPRQPPAGIPDWLKGAVIAAVVLVLAAVIYVGRKDKAAHRRQVDAMLNEGPP